MSKPRRRVSAEVMLDDVTVGHVQRAHGPAHAMLREMLPEIEVLRREWAPQLATWAGHPWGEWSGRYFVADRSGEIRTLTERLEGVEAAIATWHGGVMDLSPRAAWRFGSAWRRQAAALRHEPALLVERLQALRGRVRDAEAQVARYGPVMPSPRAPAWVATPREDVGPAWGPSKTAFDPTRVGHPS